MAMASVRSTSCLCLSIGTVYLWILGLKAVVKKLRETARRLRCEVYALQVGDDHVHVFVGLRPDCSVSKLIGLLCFLS